MVAWSLWSLVFFSTVNTDSYVVFKSQEVMYAEVIYFYKILKNVCS